MLAQGEPQPEHGGEQPSFGQAAGEPGGTGEPRHRRRGRRGGRRNRRNRDGTMAPHAGNGGDAPRPEFGGPSEFTAEPAGDVAPTHFTAEPTYTPRPEPVAAQPAAPSPASSAPQAAEPPPRRRSTVREPAPVFGDAAPAPMPAVTPPPEAMPVVTSAGDDASKPRRTGWWAKRLLGDKSES
jgi:ribonuclease E